MQGRALESRSGKGVPVVRGAEHCKLISETPPGAAVTDHGVSLLAHRARLCACVSTAQERARCPRANIRPRTFTPIRFASGRRKSDDTYPLAVWVGWSFVFLNIPPPPPPPPPPTDCYTSLPISRRWARLVNPLPTDGWICMHAC
jgi:hypothetical protein